MSRKHHAIYSDPTGAAAAASPAKRRTPRAKGSEAAAVEISSAAGATESGRVIDRDAIAGLAYSYWEARGYTGGSAEEDWLRAEREIRKGRAASAVA
jgi:uncharacterized protein involved in copper resistance